MEKYAVINSDGEIQMAFQGTPGALVLVETEPPSPLEHGFKAVARYEQQGDQIVKIWDVVPWSEQDWKNAEAPQEGGDSDD